MFPADSHDIRPVLALACVCAIASGCVGTGHVTYGTVMADVGRRFELVGKAGASGRFELARYELGEIEEQFEGTLPRAELPKEGHPEVLPALVTEFVRQGLPELRHALEQQESAATVTAFAHTAGACNTCHQASGHRFIEIPSVTGHSVPDLDPVGSRSP